MLSKPYTPPVPGTGKTPASWLSKAINASAPQQRGYAKILRPRHYTLPTLPTAARAPGVAAGLPAQPWRVRARRSLENPNNPAGGSARGASVSAWIAGPAAACRRRRSVWKP